MGAANELPVEMMTNAMTSAMSNAIWFFVAVAAVVILVWILQAILAASLASQKGYSGAAGFFIALIMPMAGLIYQAGRPLSQEIEDERQRALAVRIAKAIKKSEQAQGKANQPEEASAPVKKKFRENR